MHSVAAKVTDSGGLTTTKAIVVTVKNTAPTVKITAPVNKAVLPPSTITFTGTATDVQDGDLDNALVWTSSIQGALGVGASISKAMVVGVHTITARAVDSGAAAAQAVITLTVRIPIPTVPAGVTATASGSGLTTLRWTDSTTETAYEIQRQKYVNRAWTAIAVVASPAANATSYVDTPGPGVCRYRMRAYNGTGTSAWTGYVQVTVQ